MRKKTVLLCILAAVCCIGASVVFLYIFTPGVGTYIDAGGTPVVVLDSSPEVPLVMQNQREDGTMFSELQTGDRIVVFHDNVRLLTYPELLRVYFCIRLQKRDDWDVPEAVKDALREIGCL